MKFIKPLVGLIVAVVGLFVIGAFAGFIDGASGSVAMVGVSLLSIVLLLVAIGLGVTRRDMSNTSYW